MCTIKRDCTWQRVFWHPGNPILHKSRRMLQYCNAALIFQWLFLRHYDALGNHEELEKVKCLLKDKPGANN